LIVEFVQLLRRLDPEIGAEEIADVLWLACRIETTCAEKGGASAPEKAGDRKTSKRSEAPPEDESPPEKEADSLQCRAVRMHPRAGRGMGKGDGPGAHPIQSPGVPALPGRLDIARAFRPLKQRVDSRKLWEIDIAATADRMADTRVHWPVLKPARERWLDLSLVVEGSRSMIVWRPVVRELEKLLHRAGVFRKIETWEFAADGKTGAMALRRGDGVHRPRRAIAGPERRRVLLVVSDCVSPAWRNGSAARLMEQWTANAMAAIVQLFPEHLWSRTALRQAASVRFRMRSWGAPNRALLIFPPSDWAGMKDLDVPEDGPWKPPEGPKLPVFPLEPPYIRDWAASLAGLRRFDLPGFVLNKTPDPPAAAKPGAGKTISAETLVNRFSAVASPTARRLAGFLAATPLVMPVMRLVQATMLPDSRQSHLAEVMLSGLIRRVTPEAEGANEDEVLYDFVEGVRERLLTLNRISESVKALELSMGKIREFVDARSGRPLISFRALLADPSGLGDFRLEGDSRAFAEISVFVLKRLGGFYAEIAARLEQEISYGETETDVAAEPAHGDTLEILLGPSKIPMRFIYIQPGQFLIGSPKDEGGRFNNEKQHKVILTEGFYMQETPVTQGQWEAVMGNNPSRFKEGGPECPVELVSWKDAQEFLKKLNKTSDDLEYRLPTEAQWEYACRAGTTTPFWTGRCLSTDEANYDGNNPLEGCPKGAYREKTTPVKTFPPNPWGLYDMHGNVWEWCADWFGDYPNGPVTDPIGPTNGADRVYRGGSWLGLAWHCRSACRDLDTPGHRLSLLGFRALAVRRRASAG